MELQADDIARLDEQRGVVRIEARARFGDALTGAAEDLITLQKLLDVSAFRADQTYELQALGVCLGDVLCGMGAFRWIVVEDEYGCDPALQWKDTTINIFALTMISKRVERGEPVDVEWLAHNALERAAELEKGQP